MAEVVCDPELWESLEAGDAAFLERWLVSEGDRVRAGQVLAQAALVNERVDVTAPHAGVLEQIVVATGERFARGAVLARVIDL